MKIDPDSLPTLNPDNLPLYIRGTTLRADGVTLEFDGWRHPVHIVPEQEPYLKIYDPSAGTVKIAGKNQPIPPMEMEWFRRHFPSLFA